MSVFPIRGDGSCLFRAVAQGYSLANFNMFLKEKEETSWALYLRLKAVDYNCKTESMQPFISDKKETCVRMKSKSVYGGELEIAGMSKKFDLHIRVFERSLKNKGYSRYSEYGPKTRKPINLLYHRRAKHYELLIDGPTLARFFRQHHRLDPRTLTPRVLQRILHAYRMDNKNLAHGLIESVRSVNFRGTR